MMPLPVSLEREKRAGGTAFRLLSRLPAGLPRVFVSLAAALLLSAAAVRSGVRDPFVPGFSMGTLGAAIDDRGAGGREPWTGAAMYGDSAGFGFALCGVSYYGSTGDATSPEGISQAFGGGWYARNRLVCKASVAYFRALSVYYEQSAFLSAGAALLPFARLSIEAAGYRIGAALPGKPTRSIGEAGVSAWASWSWAAFSLRCEHLVLASAKSDGADPPPAVRFGIHASRNALGGQGATVSIVPGDPRPVCFTVGEEYFLTTTVAVQAAFSNNPVLLSFGIVFAPGGGTGLGFALVNHPVLGWSQGCSAEYRRVRSSDDAR